MSAYAQQHNDSYQVISSTTTPMSAMSTSDTRHTSYETCLTGLGNAIGILCMAPFCSLNPYRVIQEGHLGVILKFGRFDRIVRPGIYYVNLMSESLTAVNVQLQVVDVRGQSIMTKDNVNIGIDSILYYRISDVYKATFCVKDVEHAVVELTHTTLRDVLGKMTLQECVEHRDMLAQKVREAVIKPTHEWGVEVDNMLIKEIIFSTELQTTLSSAAKARRMAESKIITAQAEVESAKLLRAASDILNTDAAMQIRYLETLSMIAKNAGTKVLFLPTDQPSSRSHVMFPQQCVPQSTSQSYGTMSNEASQYETRGPSSTERAMNTLITSTVLDQL